MDFEKISSFRNASLCFKLFGRSLNPGDVQEAETLSADKWSAEERETFKQFSTAFLNSRRSSIGPLCAFLGGIVVQEIVKGMT